MNDKSACKVPERVGSESDDWAHTDLLPLGDTFWGSVNDKSACKVQERVGSETDD